MDRRWPPIAATISVAQSIFTHVLPVLAPALRSVVEKVPITILEDVEEIRIRQQQPLQLITSKHDYFVSQSGQCSSIASQAYRPTDQDRIQTLLLLSQSSLYAIEEELRRGYLTLIGGHRVGLAGRAVLTPSGGIQTLKDITYLNIRLARDIHGVADPVKAYVVDKDARLLRSSLIVSPPQSGKTTLLRDLARQLSNGQLHSSLPALKVGIVDERSEIAACVAGVPQHQIGIRTDVLDACPKSLGMLMMIRSMSPDVLIVDEIGSSEDERAIIEAVNAGVRVIGTAHGSTLEEVMQRPALRRLFEQAVFERYVFLSRRNGPMTFESVRDSKGGFLYRRERGG